MGLSVGALTSGQAAAQQKAQTQKNAQSNGLLGFDLTPGFNLTRHAGNGIPFIAHTGGTGYAPATPVGHNAPPQGGQNAFDNNTSGTYTGGGSSTPAYNPADVAYLDSQSSNLQRMLQSAQTGLNQGLTGLQDSYNQEVSGANQQRTRALEDYATQGVDSQNSKDQALGSVDSNARTLNDSLRRILGMASGSGSSAYQLAAPNAIARQASGQRENVLNSYGANARDLGVAEDRAKVDFQSLLDNLAAQRKQKESGLRGGVLQNENEINQKLANIAAQKQSILGGGFDAAQAAQRPYEAAINNNQTALDSLFEKFRTPYDVQKVNPQAVNLRDYTVDKAAVNANTQAGTQDAYSPYSTFLKRQQDQQATA